MAAYVADAYNQALPSAEDIAGHADKEFRALKERLNTQIGISGHLNVGTRLTAVEAIVTSHDQYLVMHGQRIYATESVANGAAQGVATNSSSINTLSTGFNSLSSTVSSQGSTLASHTNSLNSLNTGLGQTNANLANLSSTVSTHEVAINSHSAYINNHTATLASHATDINALYARPTILAGTYPPGAIGKDGDIYVQYV